MVTAISDVRTVPVGEDLTTENLAFSVIRGFERMHRVDKPYATGVSLSKGEWGVLQNDGTVARPSATPVPNTYPVFAGTDQFDSHATGQVTLIVNSPILVKTNKYDTGASYNVGDYLTVKDLGGGEAFVTKQAGSEPKLAKVLEVGSGTLTYELLSN